MLLLCVLYGFADSIWTGTIIVAWVQALSGGVDAPNSNKDVGYVEATQGMAMLLTAIPVGYLADKVSRQSAIRLGSVGFLIACGLTGYAVLDPNGNSLDRQYYFILGSMALWGTGQGVFNGPAMALFADSIPQGERSKWYTRLSICYMIPSLAGPLAAIILLTVYGDTWTLNELRPVFLFGVACEVPPSLLAFFMRDANALANGGDHAKKEEEKEDEEGKGEEKQTDEEVGSMDDATTTTAKMKKKKGCVTVAAIPYILFASSLVTAIGSGMTIKYFPLYFKSDITPKLSPRAVQGIYVCVPIMIAIFTVLNQALAKCLGRVQVMVLAQLVGISMLVTMSLLVDSGITRWAIIVPIYIFRTGIMNSTYPLNESILMDFVPKATRARWKSLESIASFGWCGSAVLGGVLADQTSYSSTFLYTAGLQFIGVMLQSSLMWVVPRKEKKPEGEGDADGDGEASKRGEGLKEPLLDAVGESK
jgi:MFS family permease